MYSTEFLLYIFGLSTKILTTFSVCISTPIYISVLLFINSWNRTAGINANNKQQFNSPFYSCFTALGIIDLSCYWLYMVKKFHFWDWNIPFFMPAGIPNLACSIIYFLIWMTGMAQWQLNILISLNRFVSLMFPNVYKKFWTLQLNRLYISLIFCLCTATTIPILWLPCFIDTTTIVLDEAKNITKFTGPVFKEESTRDFYNWIWKVHIYILLAICICCYIPMFVKIWRLNVTDRNKKIQYEIKMFYTLISLLVVNVFYISFLIAREILFSKNASSGRVSEWSLYILADIYDLHNPYNLLVTSKIVRRATFPGFIFYRRSIKLTPMSIIYLHNQNQDDQQRAIAIAQIPLFKRTVPIPLTSSTRAYHSK